MSIIEKVLDKLDVDDGRTARGRREKIGNQDTQDARSKAPENEKSGTATGKKTVSSETIELDFDQLKRRGMLTPDTVNITLSEQYRRIKLPILVNAFGDEALPIDTRNLVMVTSAVQGEGKSFTSFNLATSIAREFNNTVLYIDADITQRMMNKLLGVGERAGLVDFLVDGDCDLAELLLKTNIPRLTLLPSGKPYDRVTELWSSQRMLELMRELSQRYSDRLVIFDTPPILQDSSASILARLVGQVIMVVEAEKTPRHLIEEAISMLDESQYVGLVLNKSNQRDAADYGYYVPDK